jgi:hypothetical protein
MTKHGGYIPTPHAHDDFEMEAVRGVPAPLPEGERLIWQGGPEWKAFAIRVFHVRKVAIYFGLLMLWRFGSIMADGGSTVAALKYASGLLPIALIALGFLIWFARASARETIYTLTSKRILIRSGLAMQVTANFPLKRIDAVGLHVHRDGTGDLPLTLAEGDRIAILAIWPNMRPWKFSRPEPMLRSLRNPEAVGELLASALAGAPQPMIQKAADAAAAPTAAQPKGGSGPDTQTPDLRPAV